MSLDRIAEARAAYRPDHIRWLFIAEAPPAAPERFFYFHPVHTQDSLFLTMMRTLYPSDYADMDAKELRRIKPDALARFRDDGCFLEDASSEPMTGESPKEEQLRRARPALLERLEELREDDPKVVLISATVYAVCRRALKEAGWNVLNKESIPFPGSGQQRKFRDKMNALLAENGWFQGT